MSGYNYKKGMSNNAVSAYEEGKLPKSKITKQHLIDAGINETVSNVKKAIKDRYIQPCEWHHTGGDWYNETDYFDLDDVNRQINLQGGLAQYYQTKKIPSPVVRVQGSYVNWVGSRKNRRRIGKTSFTGTLKNGWIYMDNGRRKNSNGNWIEYNRI